MNMLDYANFEYDHYEPSEFRNKLVNLANEAYKAYIAGIVSPEPEKVLEFFNNRLTIDEMGDVNYDTIADDIMLYVDENNISLKEFEVGSDS